jgi:segregation and condensation protein A
MTGSPDMADADDLLPPPAPPDPEDAWVVDIDGWEGPLDLLLALARTQKVDLRQISVLQLAEQYLAHIESARRLRLELAADYLVMAAWLAFLKSRLLLPVDETAEGPTGAELAERLAFQLERLEAMRNAAAQLMGRDRLGRDMFARGMPEPVASIRHVRHTAHLIDLIQAYARVRTRDDFRPWAFDRDSVYTMEAALDRLRGGLARGVWTDLTDWLPVDWATTPARRRSARASLFAAALELVKQGGAELRQAETFAPLELRGRGGAAAS